MQAISPIHYLSSNDEWQELEPGKVARTVPDALCRERGQVPLVAFSAPDPFSA
jgi:hypothetical protein